MNKLQRYLLSYAGKHNQIEEEGMLTQPTQEQIKKFWEWCGFSIRNYPEPKIESNKKAWYDPTGNFFRGLKDMIPLDLNNLFRYAVPKLYDWRIVKDKDMVIAWVYAFPTRTLEHLANHRDKNPALALFWAIYSIITLGENNNANKSP